MNAAVAQQLPVGTMPVIKGFMFDLDGTLLLSDHALGGYEVLPGAIEVLADLATKSIPYLVFTNGSAYPPPEQAKRLRGLGLPVADDRMFTPSSVAGDVMARHGIRRALVLGKRGVGFALTEAGIQTVFPGEPHAREADAVYVGWHPECHMKDIEAACQAIWAGAKLYVASDVPFFASRAGSIHGLFVCDCRGDPAHDQGADDPDRQAFTACHALRGPTAGCARARGGGGRG